MCVCVHALFQLFCSVWACAVVASVVFCAFAGLLLSGGGSFALGGLCLSLIENDLSNYSAWHFRRLLEGPSNPEEELNLLWKVLRKNHGVPASVVTSHPLFVSHCVSLCLL